MSESAEKAVRLSNIGAMADKAAFWLLLAGALLATAGFVLSFTVAPLVNGAEVNGFELIGGQLISNKLLLSQKIFYFHMPVAIASMCALFFTAYYGVRYLMTKEARFDTCAKVATEVALVFVVCTMASGELWERFEWGVWWTWEGRLTTYLILMLLVIAYFILRNAIEDVERRAAFASVFGIIAFVDVPICFMITRLIPSSVHPVVFRTDSGLPPDMLVPLMVAMVGMLAIAFGLYRLRLRQARLAERVAAIYEQLED